MHRGGDGVPRRIFYDVLVYATVVVVAPPLHRFSRQRDTVATLTADKDGVVEAALKHGRRVEAFLVDADARSKVNKRLADTFQDSWRMRTIPVSAYAVARRPLSANKYNFHATLTRKNWFVSVLP